MSEAQVRATNGFPNNFWGWGGEDDEISERLQDCGLHPVTKPGNDVRKAAGAITDLEDLLIKERGGERAGTGVKDGGRAEWRNAWKREKRAEHAATWRTNGVCSCDFAVTASRNPAGPHVTVYTVDLHPERDKDAQKEVQAGAADGAGADAAAAGGAGAGGGVGKV